MGLVRTEAFLLQGIRFGETSMIYRLLTSDHGVVPVMARGVRRPKHRYGAHIEPFARLLVTYYNKDTRGIQTLKEAERLGDHPAIVSSLERMEAAGAWLRFVRALVPEGAPAAPLFGLAAVALARIEAAPVDQLRRWDVYHRLAAIRLLGLEPQLALCAGCGAALPVDRMAFSIEEGGALCGDCGSSRAGTVPLTGPIYALLELYSHPDWTLVRDLNVYRSEETAAREMLLRFVGYHADVGSRAARPERVR